jgi:hypothetical protein
VLNAQAQIPAVDVVAGAPGADRQPAHDEPQLRIARTSGDNTRHPAHEASELLVAEAHPWPAVGAGQIGCVAGRDVRAPRGARRVEAQPERASGERPDAAGNAHVNGRTQPRREPLVDELGRLRQWAATDFEPGDWSAVWDHGIAHFGGIADRGVRPRRRRRAIRASPRQPRRASPAQRVARS